MRENCLKCNLFKCLKLSLWRLKHSRKAGTQIPMLIWRNEEQNFDIKANTKRQVKLPRHRAFIFTFGAQEVKPTR